MEGIAVTVLAGIFLLASCYFSARLWLRRKLSYWKSLGVRQWDTQSFFGNYKDFFMLKCVEPDIVDKGYEILSGEKYGGIYLLWHPQLLVRDPELMKRIMLTDFEKFSDHISLTNFDSTDNVMHSLFFQKGETWKLNRSGFIQMFTPRKLRSMLDLIVDHFNNDVIPILDSKSSPATSCDGNDVFITKIIDDFTINAITKIFIGLDVGGPESKFVDVSKKFTYPSRWVVIKLIMYQVMPRLYKFLRLQTLDKDMWEFFIALSDNVMRAKSNQTKLGDDLVSFFQKCRSGEIKQLPNMPNEHIAAHLLIFFIAGNDTSSATLSFALYELSRNPEVQNKLREEVERITEEEGEDINYDFLRKMTYADQILQETTRMYPLLGVLTRVSNTDYAIDENVTIPKGTDVIIPCRALHYDPKYFPDPHIFNPDRFSSGAPWVWMPFGKGPRLCLGMRFSLMEMKAAMALLVRRYDILPSPKVEQPIVFNPHTIVVTNKPTDGLWIRLKQRTAPVGNK